MQEQGYWKGLAAQNGAESSPKLELTPYSILVHIVVRALLRYGYGCVSVLLYLKPHLNFLRNC